MAIFETHAAVKVDGRPDLAAQGGRALEMDAGERQTIGAAAG
jgi:hypothetical protein